MTGALILVVLLLSPFAAIGVIVAGAALVFWLRGRRTGAVERERVMADSVAEWIALPPAGLADDLLGLGGARARSWL
jgi:hypothetical protein